MKARCTVDVRDVSRMLNPGSRAGWGIVKPLTRDGLLYRLLTLALLAVVVCVPAATRARQRVTPQAGFSTKQVPAFLAKSNVALESARAISQAPTPRFASPSSVEVAPPASVAVSAKPEHAPVEYWFVDSAPRPLRAPPRSA
jgi:hypothetical protein